MKRIEIKRIGEVIGDFVRESSLGEGLLRARIFEAWDLLVADSIRMGQYTASHSFRNGVLSCRINSSVVRSHLQVQEESLRFQLNKMLQGEYVKQIKFI